MHVTCMDHVERTKSERQAMHASVRRERAKMLLAEGGVLRRGRGRAHRAAADGARTSQGNTPEPQYEPEMELVVEGVDKYQEVGDDEQQERGHHKETKKGYPINADKNINGSKVINY